MCHEKTMLPKRIALPRVNRNRGDSDIGRPAEFRKDDFTKGECALPENGSKNR
jgi:hypothetical protein